MGSFGDRSRAPVSRPPPPLPSNADPWLGALRPRLCFRGGPESQCAIRTAPRRAEDGERQSPAGLRAGRPFTLPSTSEHAPRFVLLRYTDLHLFELPWPTRVIEWTGDQRLCVAGYGNKGRNEILQLLLPLRLLAKQNKGLCPERDFKVQRGGMCDRPVYRLKHVPGTSLLVTSGPPDSALQVWRVESDETDLIKLLSIISPTKTEECSWSKIATGGAKPACVLHGLRMCNLQMTEIESGQSLFVAASASPDEIATLDFLDEATAVVCSTKGQLFLADIRQPQGLLGALEETRPPWAPGEGPSWCAGVGPGETPLVARLSSGGLVVLTDIRHPSSPLKMARCSVPTPALAGAGFLSISLAPVLGDCLAVSGFDGTVRVYNTHGWDSSGQDAKPVFVHKGHTFGTPGKEGDSPVVTTHSWHPWKPQALLSAASDGSLHVWDWSDPRASELSVLAPSVPPPSGSVS